MSGTVTKHVMIIGELASTVSRRHLLEVSEIEQEIACQDQHSQHLQRVRSLISKISNTDAVRLVMLYALKYQDNSHSDITGLVEALKKKGVSPQTCEMVYRVLEYSMPIEESTSSNIPTQKAMVKITKRIFKDLKGVENVYTQHSPILKDILEDLIKGRLREASYPFLHSPQGNSPSSRRVQDVMVFVVGGTTYEESLTVHMLNKTIPGVRIVLGGTTVHNSSSFLEEVAICTQGMMVRPQKYK